MSHGKTLKALVDNHILKVRPKTKREMEFYKAQKSLSEAVEKSSLAIWPSGSIHPHQRRVGEVALKKAHEALRCIDFKGVKDFDELHSMVYGAISNIHRIGPLAIYDIAHRIGAFLGIKPNKVYLHVGTLEGAKALGINCTPGALSMDQLPPELKRLEPSEVEDFLCIFKKQLSNISQ